MEQIIERRLKSIMAAVFEKDISLITDDASPDTIETWDSLHHMNLIVALEEEFSIQLDDDDIEKMMSFRVICASLRDKYKVNT